VPVNDFTIEEPQQREDRPLLRTCVPKQVLADLHDVRLCFGITWSGGSSNGTFVLDPSENLVWRSSGRTGEEGYAADRSILGRATLKDRITIFSLADGALFQFKTLAQVRIAPIPRGRIGGAHNATTSEGHQFSGLSSHVVPERGLMEGEPGMIWFDDGKLEHGEDPPSLNAEVYVDEEQFDDLFASMRDTLTDIDLVHLNLTVELFEDKVQGFFMQGWMSREFGLLMKGEKAQTRARLTSLQVRLAKAPPPVGPPDDAAPLRDAPKPGPTAAPPPDAGAEEVRVLLRALHKRSGWVLATLIALLVVTLFR
jgi:hypothetical protein